MNRIATALVAIWALLLGGAAILVIIAWVARSLENQFGAGEIFGIGLGIVLLGWAAGLAWASRAIWRDERGGWILATLSAIVSFLLAYIALSTPGPPPIPVPGSVAMVVTGLAMVGLAIARSTGRRTR